MKTLFSTPIGLCLAVLVLVSPSTLLANNQSCGSLENTPNARFTVQDNTVLDNETGLMWTQACIGGCDSNAAFFDWQNIGNVVLNFNRYNLVYPNQTLHNDWRVPNIKELTSIVEFNCYLPSMNTSVFNMNTDGTILWSNSAVAGSDKAYAIDFTFGQIETRTRNSIAQLLLVR